MTRPTTPPETPDAQPRPVAVFDVSSLRFRFGPGRRTVSVLSASGQHLATVECARTAEPSDAAYAALTEAQRYSTVLLPGPDGIPVGHTIALYNPFTAHIGVRLHADDPEVVLGGDPFAIPAHGMAAVLHPPAPTGTEETAGGRTLRTPGGDLLAREQAPDAFATSRALAAYS